ncbi:hypothetical protein PoB_005925500 [Plakobranchus ocellatus]|uniref:Uncharacterized protein n=1 Tax=Plakobranchus ocellatus TaxID=259542 RepID=A0AAV4CLA9_9GAST|nr:hypothetical protein PoB_005925500 [Plakobranchus ocellatus]
MSVPDRAPKEEDCKNALRPLGLVQTRASGHMTHHVISGVQEAQKDGSDRGHATGEGQTPSPALYGIDGGFGHLAGWVAQAGVQRGALVGQSDAKLTVTLIDRVSDPSKVNSNADRSCV